MLRRLISSGSAFEATMGYSRVVVVDGWVMVSGTTGFNYETMSISEDVAQQAEQVFRNIANALAGAGATLADVVRVRYIFPRAEDFEPCLPVKAATSRK
jgi:enamine deaminase RidA (YjgF/YER057c/UK114 family)